MRMSLANTSGWRFREAPFSLQQTYVTPLKELPRFVETLVQPFALEKASACIELFVFEPTQLIWYLRGFGIRTDEGELNRATLQAENRTEALDLLECMLAQWADFAFIPSPEGFAVYADHDEYTTVFTEDAEALASIHEAMCSLGFKAVDNWRWTGPHSHGTIEQNKGDV
jgi:hypothetical protein